MDKEVKKEKSIWKALILAMLWQLSGFNLFYFLSLSNITSPYLSYALMLYPSILAPVLSIVIHKNIGIFFFVLIPGLFFTTAFCFLFFLGVAGGGGW